MNEEDDTYNGNEGVDLSSWSFVISYTPQDAFTVKEKEVERK